MNLGAIFSTANRDRSDASRQAFARFELLRSGVQFLAALCFLGGSTLSLIRNPESPSGWLFIAGSILFCAAPAIRLWSEIALYRMGRTDVLAERSVGVVPQQFDDLRREQEERKYGE